MEIQNLIMEISNSIQVESTYLERNWKSKIQNSTSKMRNPNGKPKINTCDVKRVEVTKIIVTKIMVTKSIVTKIIVTKI